MSYKEERQKAAQEIKATEERCKALISTLGLHEYSSDLNEELVSIRKGFAKFNEGPMPTDGSGQDFDSAKKFVRSVIKQIKDAPDVLRDAKADMMAATADYVNKYATTVTVSVEDVESIDPDAPSLVVTGPRGDRMVYQGESSDKLIRSLTGDNIMLIDYQEHLGIKGMESYMGANARMYANITKDLVEKICTELSDCSVDIHTNIKTLNSGQLDSLRGFLDKWKNNECKRVMIEISGSLDRPGKGVYLTMDFENNEHSILKYGLGSREVPLAVKQELINTLFTQLPEIESPYIKSLFEGYVKRFEQQVEPIKALAQKMDGCSQYIKESANIIYGELLTAEGREGWKRALGADEKLFPLYRQLYMMDKFFEAPAVMSINDEDGKLVLDISDEVTSPYDIAQFTEDFYSAARGLEYDLEKNVKINYPHFFSPINPVAGLDYEKDITVEYSEHYISFPEETVQKMFRRAFGEEKINGTGKMYVDPQGELYVRFDGINRGIPLTAPEKQKLQEAIKKYDKSVEMAKRNVNRPV